MKRKALTLVLSIMIFLILVPYAVSQDTKNINFNGDWSVGASIDEKFSPRSTTFTIAPGLTTSNFHIIHFVKGYTWDNRVAKTLGFQIVNTANGAVVFASGSLPGGGDSTVLFAGFSLVPGTYRIEMTEGGKNASIVVSFSVP